MFFGVAVAEVPAYAQYRPTPAVYRNVPVAEGRPLPFFGGVGTGGVESVEFLTNRQGYRLVTVLRVEQAEPGPTYEPYAALMQDVQTGFGRTLSHLPPVFGVSRQTLYNWMKGEVPKEQHRDRLLQLAEAAKVFTAAGFKPSGESLGRTVAKGKSFVDLLSDGANGRETAEKLIRIVKRGAAERESLDAILGDRKAPALSVSDLARRSFPEGA